jgi:hypothetical protein
MSEIKDTVVWACVDDSEIPLRESELKMTN